MASGIMSAGYGGSRSDGWPSFTSGLADGEPYELYLVTNPKVQRSLNLRPFDIRVKTVDFCADQFEFRDDLHEVPKLLALLRRAHAMSSTDPRRVMPRWMLVDLVLMPSAVLLALVGQEHLNSVARELEADGAGAHPGSRGSAAVLRDLLRLAYEHGYDGPLPVAGYAAIPTSRPRVWLGGSQWWSLVHGQRLGYSVRRIALECYRAEREVGVTQFIHNASALRAQNDFGKLRVTHTHLAVHPRPGTFVYEVDLRTLPPDGRPAPVSPPTEGAYPLDPGARGLAFELMRIQRKIARGEDYYMAAPPRDDPNAWPVIYAEDQGPHRSDTRVCPGRSVASGASGGDWFTKGIRTGTPYKAYIISSPGMFDFLELAPFGIRLEQIDICASTFRVADGGPEPSKRYPMLKLLDLLSRAIALSYAESGLGTPKWAMVELALMPSAVLVVMAEQGYLADVAARLKREPVLDLRKTRLIPLVEDDRNRLRNAQALLDLLDAANECEYDGPLPVAGYAATPTPRSGRWVGWSLWSLVPGERLGYTVKRLALACYRVTTQTAVVQFRMARGLDVITKFGTPKLLTVDVHPHPAPNAFMYEMDVSKLKSDGSPVSPRKERKAWQLMQIDPDSRDLAKELERMQHDIERSTEYLLLPRPAGEARSPLIPVRRRRVVHGKPQAYRRILLERRLVRRVTKRRAGESGVARQRE